ncbi:peptidoglycan editing factor PgeF [Virgibacillus senegalensis]|uniref:peptidoglycan editing factor PgeF n=1 Tax=Virgibacillus senegalensis TaxID=1499679 RepID=UPI00069E766B|nr:peptidoglycan editing factor PgeF [Virgibacillus senegalensis]
MKSTFQRTDDSAIFIDGWNDLAPGLMAGFTTRRGGVSVPPFDTFNLGLHVTDDQDAVIANRERLAGLTGFPLANWVSAQQVHGTEIAVVTEADKGRGAKSTSDAIQGADGLITNETGIFCTAFFADCVPLYFLDPETRWIGIAHAGWRGTVNGMAEEMIAKLEKNGVKAENVLAAIGPSIGPSSYQVDDKVISQIPDGLKGAVVTRKETGAFLDLQLLNERILQQAGVPTENISRTTLCTFQENHLFFSHRRDHGKTGRMLGFIGWQE